MSKTIFVSAGHGGPDPGVVANGHREADLALELRDLVAAELTAKGFDVATDGAAGVNEPLVQAIHGAAQRDLAVEFHLNSGPDTAHGVEALSMPAQKALAQELTAAVSSVLGNVRRGDNGWKADNEGQHHSLGFCRQAAGVVLEVFFLTNTDELAVYLTKKAEMADAIACALANAAQ